MSGTQPDPLLREVMEDWSGLRRLAQSLLRGDAAADDVVQSAYAVVLAGARPTRGGDARAWMRAVVRRLAGKHVRTEVRMRRRQTVAATRRDGACSQDTADTTQRLEERASVLAELRAMQDPQRHVLYLRYFEDLTPTQIADRLGAPVATVKTWLHRGLERLRDRLDRRHDGRRERWQAALLPLLDVRPRLPKGVWVKSAAAAGLLVAATGWLGTTWSVSGDAQSAGVRASLDPEGAGVSGPTLQAASARRNVDPGRLPEAAPGSAASGSIVLAGTVVDERRSAVPGVRVWLATPDGASIETRTGADGRFALRGAVRPAGPTPWLVRAEDGGLAAVAVTWVRPARGWRAREDEPQEVGSLVLAPSSALAIEVASAAAPTGAVRVRIVPERYYAPTLAEALADAHGRAHFRDLPAGPLRVEAESGAGLRAVAYAEMPDSAGRTVRLHLAPSRPVVVRVLDSETGKPVPGAAVRVRVPGSAQNGTAVMHWLDERPTTTDREGRASVPGLALDDAEVDVSATAPGYLEARTVCGIPARAPAELSVSAERAATVTWPISTRDGPAPTDGTPLALALTALRDLEVSASVVEGRVLVTGLPRRRFTGCVTEPGGASAVVEWDGVAAAGPPVAFERLPGVDVLVETADGRPAAAWNVAIWSRDGALPGRTDERGRVLFHHVPPGPAVLVAHGDRDHALLERVARWDVTPDAKPVHVRLGEMRDVRLRLQSMGRPIACEGVEPSFATVHCESPFTLRGQDPPLCWDPSELSTLRLVVLDGPGEEPARTLLVRGYLPVDLHLPQADADGRIRATVELLPAASLVVRLRRPLDRSLEPTAPRWDSVTEYWRDLYDPTVQRWDAERAGWVLEPRGPWRRCEPVGAWEGPQRAWRLTPLTPGRYRVLDPRTGAASASVELVPGAPEAIADLDLTHAWTLRGSVTAAPGRDLAGASVAVEDLAPTDPDALPSRSVPVAPDGSIALPVSGLRPVRVGVEHPLLSREHADSATEVYGPRGPLHLRLVGGPEATARILLGEGARPADISLGGRVLLYQVANARAAPEERALLAESPGGTSREIAVRFGGFRGGTYDVWIDLPGAAPRRIPGIVLREGDNDLGTITLERGPGLEVRLRRASGGGVAWVEAAAQGLGEPCTCRTGRSEGSAQGDVLLVGLTPGRQRVRVSYGLRPESREPTQVLEREVVVGAGGEVVLEIEVP